MTKEKLVKINGQKILRSNVIIIGVESDICITQINTAPRYEIVLSHIFPLLENGQVDDVWLLYDGRLNVFAQLFQDFKEALECFIQISEQRLKETFL